MAPILTQNWRALEAAAHIRQYGLPRSRSSPAHIAGYALANGLTVGSDCEAPLAVGDDGFFCAVLVDPKHAQVS
jgi:hypothetical protein